MCLTDHSLKRINERYPIFAGKTCKEIKHHLDHLRNQALVVYYEPTNKTNVYIGSFYKLVIGERDRLVTFIA